MHHGSALSPLLFVIVIHRESKKRVPP